MVTGSIPGMPPTYLILQSIRSAHNVGAILRTADGAGVSKVYLCGYTPAPIDRFGRTRKDIGKVALGAEDTVPWEQVPDITALIHDLKREGVRIVALEQDGNSTSYLSLERDQPTAFILGEEVRGIPTAILDMCDGVVEIPMRGKKNSLNVSVAAGVLLFSYHRDSTTAR